MRWDGKSVGYVLLFLVVCAVVVVVIVAVVVVVVFVVCCVVDKRLFEMGWEVSWLAEADLKGSCNVERRRKTVKNWEKQKH